MGLPVPIARFLAGNKRIIDGRELHPIAQIISERFVKNPGEVPELLAHRSRIEMTGDWFTHPMSNSVNYTQITLAGPDGNDILCDLYRPKALKVKAAPVLLFFHGGGHVAGSIASHRGVCHQLAKQVNCIVISVEYRLAPEYPFPAGILDSLAAYDQVVTRCKELGVDPTNIAVGGDSAGANIAAIIAQQRKSAQYPPKCQMLWVPWVDLSTQRPSYGLYAEGFFLEKREMEWYTEHYLPNKEDAFNPLVSPMFGDLQGLCPAVVLVAGHDPLRDEGLEYAEKMSQAGVAVTLKSYERLFHQFINVAGCLDDASVAFDEAADLLKAQFSE